MINKDVYQRAKEVEKWFKQSVMNKQKSHDIDTKTNSEKDKKFAYLSNGFLSRASIDYIETWGHAVHIHDLKNKLMDLSKVLKIEKELPDECLKNLLLKAKNVVQVMPDIFAMRNWHRQKREWYIEQLVFILRRKVIETLSSIGKPIPIEEMLVKVCEMPEVRHWLGDPKRNRNLLNCLLEMCPEEDLALSQSELSRSHKLFQLRSWVNLPESKSTIVTTYGSLIFGGKN